MCVCVSYSPAFPICTASLVSFPWSTDFSFLVTLTFFTGLTSSFSSDSAASSLFKGCISRAMPSWVLAVRMEAVKGGSGRFYGEWQKEGSRVRGGEYRQMRTDRIMEKIDGSWKRRKVLDGSKIKFEWIKLMFNWQQNKTQWGCKVQEWLGDEGREAEKTLQNQSEGKLKNDRTSFLRKQKHLWLLIITWWTFGWMQRAAFHRFMITQHSW